MAGLTISNPLALSGGSVKIGSTSTPKGMSNNGTLISSFYPAPAAVSAPAPTPSGGGDGSGSGGSSGSGSGSGSSGALGAATTTPSLPYTQQQLDDYNVLKNSTMNSINDAVTQGGQGYNSSLLDYLDSRRQQQNTINNDSIQNELSRQQGMQGILDMLHNGLQSGGVMLANHNAGSSSAADALARAYSLMARQQASQVGNQFAQGQNKIGTEENNLALADTTENRHANEDKTNIINSIINQTRSQLAALNQSAAFASIPDRVDIEAKVAAVKQQALDALSAYDNVLSNGYGQADQQRLGGNDILAKAHALLVAGVAPEQQFNYTTSAPAQFQDTGPAASNLPIYTLANSKKTTQ